MPGSARITLAVGFALVVAAWIAGSLGLPVEYRTATDILAVALAVPLVLLAARYRRHRLAVAAVLIAGADLAMKSVVARTPDDAALTPLVLVVAANLAMLAVIRDRPLSKALPVAWLAITVLLTRIAIAGVNPPFANLTAVLSSPSTAPAAFAVTAAVAIGSFAVRRGAFGASLVWVVVASAGALLASRGPHPGALLFAAAQITLLTALLEEAYRLAYHDQLTGLPGRRALDEAMRGLGGDFTIAMVDVDHFKRFNDRWGHDAGDQALRMVADELDRVGGGGRAHRYGGEEFAILFPGSAVRDVRDELDQVRVAIEQRRFALRAPDRPKTRPEKLPGRTSTTRRVTVTVSIGTADSNPRRPTPAAVLRAADRALYRAKKAGRNRLVAAGDRL